MATSSLVDFPDLISTKNRTESLALPDVKRINNIAKFMADPLNFDGDITKLAARFEDQAKQCQDVINLLNDQIKVKTTTLHQVKEDMLELQRQLKQPDATFVYVIMKTKVLVKFLDETEMNEYEVPSALERFNLKMSCLYGEILALDSDIDHTTYLKGVATVNSQYVKDWHKREMAKNLQIEPEDPKGKEPGESLERENDTGEESDEEFWESLKHANEPEKKPKEKSSEAKEPELKDREDEPDEVGDSSVSKHTEKPEMKVIEGKIPEAQDLAKKGTKDKEPMENLTKEKDIEKKDSQMKMLKEKDPMKMCAESKDSNGKLPEKKVSKEKVIGKGIPEEMKVSNEKKLCKETDAKVAGEKILKIKITKDTNPNQKVIEKKVSDMKVTGEKNLKKDNENKDAKGKLPEKNVPKETGLQKKVAGKNAPKEIIIKKLPEKNFSKQKVAGKNVSEMQATKAKVPVKNRT